MDPINENITAFVDDQITDPQKVKEIEKAISACDELRFEYNVQRSVKNLLRERFAGRRAPEQLRESVIQATIKSNNVPAAKPQKSFDIWSIFKSPRFAFAAIILFGLVFYFNNGSTVDPVELFNEQSGNFNMAVQAERNFNSIINGELAVQIASNNPEEILKFFKKNGVNYICSVPTFNDWNLVGAVVSEDKGQKFAHHVYTGKEGQILYLYQVERKYFTSMKVLDLSSDLINYLTDGNVVKINKPDHNTFLWISGNNVYSLVSNENPNLIENKFLAGFL
ncbi:MAG: hypothetical protein PVH88_21090 [Ignavibacteria bacterium]|jgi:hypothetical protein